MCPMSPRLLRPRARGGFDPRTVSGLKLWLDASDSSSYTLATGVSEWRDKSGNGHAYTQAVGANQPLVVAGPGGRNCLDFDGGNDRLIGGASTLGLLRNVTGCTVYVARKADTNNATRGVINWAQSTSATRRLGMGFTSTAYRSDNFFVDTNQGQVLPNYTATPATVWEVQSVRIICGTNPGGYQRLNGSDVASANWISTAPSASSDTDSFDAHVGFAVIAGSPAYWDGLIGEVLMWQRVLTATELSAIDAYLSARWV